jgi:hypothetical protein
MYGPIWKEVNDQEIKFHRATIDMIDLIYLNTRSSMHDILVPIMGVYRLAFG